MADYAAEFDSAFVRRLNESEWVPDDEGNLQRPALIPFEALQWTPNPFLLSKIRFKPPDHSINSPSRPDLSLKLWTC